MLYPQIPKTVRDKIAAELNINTGLLNITLKENQDIEDRFYDKLNLIVKYMEKHLNVGTIDSPEDYFKGILPMQWGPYGHENSELVYFGGITNAGTVLGLGGSFHNVIGEERGQSRPHSHSGTSTIISKLKKELDNTTDRRTENELEERNGVFSGRSSDSIYQRCVYLATSQMEGPVENFEFIAKKLIAGNRDGSLVVLGTPIYVAYVEKMTPH
jgi:hypothetical protein